MTDWWKQIFFSHFLLSRWFTSWKSKEKWFKKQLLCQLFFTSLLKTAFVFSYFFTETTPESICNRPRKRTPWSLYPTPFGLGLHCVALIILQNFYKFIKNGIFIKVLVFYFTLLELPALFDHQRQDVSIGRNNPILSIMNFESVSVGFCLEEENPMLTLKVQFIPIKPYKTRIISIISISPFFC